MLRSRYKLKGKKAKQYFSGAGAGMFERIIAYLPA